MAKITEKWKQLYDYEDYQVSNTGKIKSVDRIIEDKNGVTYPKDGRVLKSRRSKTNPHLFIEIHFIDENLGNQRRTIYIQKAVADHFIKKPSSDHIYSTNISGDYDDNNHTNIKWITHKELISRQPKRIENPKKAWQTRINKYGSSGMRKTKKQSDNELY